MTADGDAHNPYAAPADASQVDAAAGDAGLATRWMRLMASIFDGVLLMVFIWMVLYAGFGITIANAKERMGLGEQVISAISAFAFFFAVNGYLLATNGQTLGKRIAKIRVVLLDGGNISLRNIVLLRYLPLWAAGYIPFVGGFVSLVDALFIFRSDRRCIHDLIAGTKVVACR